MNSSVAAIEAMMVDLVSVIRASAMKEKLLVVVVLVFVLKMSLLDCVITPKCAVLHSLNLCMQNR